MIVFYSQNTLEKLFLHSQVHQANLVSPSSYGLNEYPLCFSTSKLRQCSCLNCSMVRRSYPYSRYSKFRKDSDYNYCCFESKMTSLMLQSMGSVSSHVLIF